MSSNSRMTTARIFTSLLSHMRCGGVWSIGVVRCDRDVAVALQSNVQKFATDLKSVFVSAHAMSAEFKQSYERSPVPPMTTVAMRYERVQASAKTEKIPIFDREFAESVFKP